MATEMERLAAEMKAKSESDSKARENLQKQVERWPGQVRDLIDTLDEWLFPLEQFGLSTQAQTEKKREHDFDVEVPKLVITYNQNKATTDATLFCMGYRGRIDLKGPNRAELTMVMEETEQGAINWHMLTRGSNRFVKNPLTQDHLVEFIRKAFKI